MPQSILDVAVQRSTIRRPSNNSNWPLLNDQAINKAIDKARERPDARSARRVRGKIDDQISALAPAIPWVWDNETYIRSKDVAGVVNLFNAEWDLSFSSVRAAREGGLSERSSDHIGLTGPAAQRAAGPARPTTTTLECFATSLSRVLWGIAMLFIVSAVVFMIFYVFPSADPAKLRAGRNASPDTIRAIRKELDLNQPVYVQYKNFMFGQDSYVHLQSASPSSTSTCTATQTVESSLLSSASARATTRRRR